MMIRAIYLLLALTAHATVSAQWDSYQATWEGQPGLMMVQTDLKDQSPYPELPHLMVITQNSIGCDELGYPDNEFLAESDHHISQVEQLLDGHLYIEYAGRLIYQCSTKDYIYVEDSTAAQELLDPDITARLDVMYKADPEWKIYRDFIHPDDFLMQTMVNGRILKSLQEEGILIEEKKRLTHFASFQTSDDLHDYRRFLIGLNYKVEEIVEKEDIDYPHIIHFSRKDRLVVEKLSNTTLRLHQRATSLNGTYGGWEIVID